MYSVSELREQWKEKVLELGLDPKWTENPAFYSALDEADGLISQMNMMSDADSVTVAKKDNTISFSWKDSVGNKFKFNLEITSPGSFTCLEITERTPRRADNGQMVRSIEYIEKVAEISEKGFVTLTSRGAVTDDYKCELGECKVLPWAVQKEYNNLGIMFDRDYKSFPVSTMSRDVYSLETSSALLIAREAFKGGFANAYDSRTVIRREKLDTARVYFIDKTHGQEYNATVPLNQENGLQDMVLNGGYDPCPEHIQIDKKTPEQIKKMISSERDPKIREGLQMYAKGREDYSYDSDVDRDFIRNGFIPHQGL